MRQNTFHFRLLKEPQESSYCNILYLTPSISFLLTPLLCFLDPLLLPLDDEPLPLLSARPTEFWSREGEELEAWRTIGLLLR